MSGGGLGFGRNFPIAALPSGKRDSVTEREKLLAASKPKPSQPSVAPPSLLPVNARKPSGRAGAAPPGGQTRRGGTKRPQALGAMGMASWTWSKVKAHMEAVTQYPRPLVQLFRKVDGRRWPSTEFPAHLLMGQVFRNGDDLAAVIEPPPPAERYPEPSPPPPPAAPLALAPAELAVGGREAMMAKLKARLDELAAEKEATEGEPASVSYKQQRVQRSGSGRNGTDDVVAPQLPDYLGVSGGLESKAAEVENDTLERKAEVKVSEKAVVAAPAAPPAPRVALPHDIPPIKPPPPQKEPPSPSLNAELAPLPETSKLGTSVPEPAYGRREPGASRVGRATSVRGKNRIGSELPIQPVTKAEVLAPAAEVGRPGKVVGRARQIVEGAMLSDEDTGEPATATVVPEEDKVESEIRKDDAVGEDSAGTRAAERESGRAAMTLAHRGPSTNQADRNGTLDGVHPLHSKGSGKELHPSSSKLPATQHPPKPLPAKRPDSKCCDSDRGSVLSGVGEKEEVMMAVRVATGFPTKPSDATAVAADTASPVERPNREPQVTAARESGWSGKEMNADDTASSSRETPDVCAGFDCRTWSRERARSPNDGDMAAVRCAAVGTTGRSTKVEGFARSPDFSTASQADTLEEEDRAADQQPDESRVGQNADAGNNAQGKSVEHSGEAAPLPPVPTQPPSHPPLPSELDASRLPAPSFSPSKDDKPELAGNEERGDHGPKGAGAEKPADSRTLKVPPQEGPGGAPAALPSPAMSQPSTTELPGLRRLNGDKQIDELAPHGPTSAGAAATETAARVAAPRQVESPPAKVSPAVASPRRMKPLMKRVSTPEEEDEEDEAQKKRLGVVGKRSGTPDAEKGRVVGSDWQLAPLKVTVRWKGLGVGRR